MVKKANNKVETDGEDEEEKMPPLKDVDDVYVEYSVEGETLVVRSVLSSSFIRCKTFSHQ
jgi:hypothetical protein